MPKIAVKPSPSICLEKQTYAITPSTTVYDTGDVMGGAISITNAAKYPGGSGIIRRMMITDPTSILDCTIMYTTSSNFGSDHNPFIWTTSDNADLLGQFTPSVVAFPSTTGNRVWISTDEFYFVSDSDNQIYLYVYDGTGVDVSDQILSVVLWIDKNG